MSQQWRYDNFCLNFYLEFGTMIVNDTKFEMHPPYDIAFTIDCIGFHEQFSKILYLGLCIANRANLFGVVPKLVGRTELKLDSFLEK